MKPTPTGANNDGTALATPTPLICCGFNATSRSGGLFGRIFAEAIGCIIVIVAIMLTLTLTIVFAAQSSEATNTNNISTSPPSSSATPPAPPPPHFLTLSGSRHDDRPKETRVQILQHHDDHYDHSWTRFYLDWWWILIVVVVFGFGTPFLFWPTQQYVYVRASAQPTNKASVTPLQSRGSTSVSTPIGGHATSASTPVSSRTAPTSDARPLLAVRV